MTVKNIMEISMSHTPKQKNRADLFSDDEIQMLYWKGKLGACKLSYCTLIF